jgi:putative transposase
MARLPRLYAPDTPQLVQTRFVQPLASPSEATPGDTLDLLRGWLDRDACLHRVALHGWLLLNDRICLLATPSEAKGLPRLMQSLGRRMALLLRQGSVFAGRYRSALVQPGVWMIPALVWLESLPAQLRYVDRPEAWPWSSASWHVGATLDKLAAQSDHPDYWACGNTPFARQSHWRLQLSQGLSQNRARHIAQSLHGQWVLGEPDFLQRLAPIANRRLTPDKRGRPRKSSSTADHADSGPRDA